MSMLQRLTFAKSDFPILKQYLAVIKQRGFSGDIDIEPSMRLVNATDNSAYQILPQAIVAPKTEHDVVLLFKVAHEPTFHRICFTPRGGGTGTNGQSLNDTIIIDCSKYLTQILEFNLKEQWVRVQAGVVLDKLNQFLQPSGFFFAPTLSTSNRATLGGMANTDACGKGSLVYGKTSQHILAIKAVYTDGTLHSSQPIDKKTLEQLKQQDNILATVYQQVDNTVTEKRDVINDVFPKLTRFMTGYNLAHVYSQQQDNPFNLNAILTGSEGTLAVVTELQLKLTPIPQHNYLLVLQYESFNDALCDAANLLKHRPHAIETIDSTILDLAKTDVNYQYLSPLLDINKALTCAVNLVEFAGDNAALLEKKLAKIMHQWKIAKPLATHHIIVTKPDEIKQLWNLRKQCVGLLGKTPGWRKPTSGIEDTVVPPEHLANYVAELQQLLDKAGLKYGLFGHIDVGCLHVRPALDMSDPHDEALYLHISEQVAHLTKKYHGLMWGEHGKGYRSQYVPLFFDTVLYEELRKIKQAFDPFNQLNPGKIATPANSSAQLVTLDSPKRGMFDREITHDLKHQYQLAIFCNGNGACFNYNVLDTMCPSYKATQDRRHSPKGRAALLREWIRLQSTAKPAGYTPRGLNSMLKLFKQYDFSHEVKQALDGCLGCNACASECPVNVDIPSMKAPFLESYHSRYWHSLRDYVVAYSERWALQMSRLLPNCANLITHNPISHYLLKQIGLTDLPLLSSPNLKQRCKTAGINVSKITDLAKLTQAQCKQSIVLVQDWLTSCYQAELVMDYYHFLTRCGYTVYLLEPFINGKTWHALGFLKKFDALAEKTAAQLQAIADLAIPMIGIEPSLTLTYRQEYCQRLQHASLPIYLIEEWLIQHPPKLTQHAGPDMELYILPHCCEKAADPLAANKWQTIFAYFGINLKTLPLGCCGMAGHYGLETAHLTTSRQLFNFGWRKAVSEQACLVTGFSCRKQVKRLTNCTVIHPISYLNQLEL